MRATLAVASPCGAVACPAARLEAAFITPVASQRSVFGDRSARAYAQDHAM
ncbi:hypothetical protein EBME_0493 [bacterium endosymbiont of Mortierella elongata FMR23-6]|nr:hypothetical protein [Mycoavidus cysteinexigens]GAM52030.1 hypothetical protein EBME_0493 [bacterium endosymbiont of Mortierella elongata FMR23-6]